MLKYNSRTGELFDAEGRLLKQLHCPIRKCWNQLRRFGPMDRERACDDCGDSVVNLGALTPDAAEALLQEKPETCVYIHADSPGIQFVSSSLLPGRSRRPMRVIETVRSLEAMNAAAARGLRPLVKRVPAPRLPRHKMAVYQHRKTGEVYVAGDFRDSMRESAQWVRVLDWFWFTQPLRPYSPLAAYLIPRDLDVGERVMLRDLIEELPGSGWNQGDLGPMASCEAVWTGADFVLDLAKADSERIHAVG